MPTGIYAHKRTKPKRGTPEYRAYTIVTSKRFRRTHKGRFSSLRAQARAAGRTMGISFEYFVILRSHPCNYCGGSLPESGSGMDRLDNRIGYTLSNTVACCGQCNRDKGRLEQIGFTYPRTVELMLELRR